MGPGVIVGLDPGDQQPVELGQAADPPGGLTGGIADAVDLDQELLADGAEEPLDLAATLGPARGGVDQPDAQHRAGAQQPGVHKRRAVVDRDLLGHAAGGQRRPQRRGQPHGVLTEPEPGRHDRPAVVVDEAEQERLAPVDDRAVQRITGPQLVGPVGLEPAEGLPRRRGQLPVQRQPDEVALQGPLRRCPARLGP
jgi:hypothetical protein